MSIVFNLRGCTVALPRSLFSGLPILLFLSISLDFLFGFSSSIFFWLSSIVDWYDEDGDNHETNWSDDNDPPERGNVQTQSWRCWGLFLCRAAFLGLRLGPGVILMLVGMIRIIIIDHLPDSAAPFILDESSFKLSHVVKRLRLHNVLVTIS